MNKEKDLDRKQTIDSKKVIFLDDRRPKEPSREEIIRKIVWYAEQLGW